jgi:hypothetical protein
VFSLLYAAFGAVAGSVASPWIVAVGGFGMGLSLALINGVYFTIVLVKVPLRFHGRVFALNQTIAWSTIPLACGLLAPEAARVLGGVVRSPSRGIGLTFELFALAMAAVTVFAMRTRSLATFDETVPDAPVDDLLGVSALGDRLVPRQRNDQDAEVEA